MKIYTQILHERNVMDEKEKSIIYVYKTEPTFWIDEKY
jgi:hypothetical protein